MIAPSRPLEAGSLGKPFIRSFMKYPGAPGVTQSGPPVLQLPKGFPLVTSFQRRRNHPVQVTSRAQASQDYSPPRLFLHSMFPHSMFPQLRSLTQACSPDQAQVQRKRKGESDGTLSGVYLSLIPGVPSPACLPGHLSIRGRTPKWKFFKTCFVSLYQSKRLSCLG